MDCLELRCRVNQYAIAVFACLQSCLRIMCVSHCWCGFPGVWGGGGPDRRVWEDCNKDAVAVIPALQSLFLMAQTDKVSAEHKSLEEIRSQLQLVLLDFGLAEELTPRVRKHFISFLHMISAGNGRKAAHHMLLFSTKQVLSCCFWIHRLLL